MAPTEPSAAVILDRDGVINDHRHYVNSRADFILFDDSAAAIQQLNEHNYLVAVATNQGGVGLGYMSAEALQDVHDFMLSELRERGARIDEIAVCPHAPQAGCPCRKPKPGLLLALQERLNFNPALSYMVGDRETDVQAGQAAGTKTVKIGKGPSKADYIAANLSDAVRWILADANGAS